MKRATPDHSLLETHLAKVALASGLALKEEKLKIHKQALDIREKCLACELPISQGGPGYIVCKEKVHGGCRLVLKCNQLSCPGINHSCYLCNTPACLPVDRHNNAPLVIGCTKCERPLCDDESCISECEICGGFKGICRNCSPGPFFLYSAPPFKEIFGENNNRRMFCAEHLQERNDFDSYFLSALEACDKCKSDYKTQGYLYECLYCRKDYPVFVCQHTDAGPGQKCCPEHRVIK